MDRFSRNIFIALTVFLAPSCQAPLTGNAPPPVPVKASALTLEERPWIVERPARLEASDAATLKAEWDVRVRAVPVDVGVRVNTGQLLARIEHERVGLEIEKKRAELKELSAKAAYEKARAKSKPQAETEEKGKEGEAEEEEKITPEKMELSEATLERIRAEIAQLEADADKTEIVSPIDGIITKKSIVEGLAISKGDELFQIIRIDPIRIAFDLPSEQVNIPPTLENIVVTFPPFEGITLSPDQLVVSPERDAGGQIRLTIPLSNRALHLKAGMEGTVTLMTTKRLQVLKVPTRAVLEQGGKKFVFRLSDDVVHKVEVETGGEQIAGQVEVIRGLNIQDQIVIEGLKGLKDGQTVEVR